MVNAKAERYTERGELVETARKGSEKSKSPLEVRLRISKDLDIH